MAIEKVANDQRRIECRYAILVINELSRRQNEATVHSPLSVNSSRVPHYWDVTGNSSVSALDALRVINQLALINKNAATEKAEA